MKKLLFVFSLILVSLLLVSCFPGQEQDETINLTIQPDSSSFISEYDGHTVNWNKIEYSLFYNGNFLKEGDLTVNEISGPFVFSNLVSGNYEVNIRVINDGFVIAKIQKSFNLTKDNNTFNASYEMMDSNLEIEVTDNRSDKSLDVTHNIIISNESGIIAEDSITNEATSNLVFNPGLYTVTVNQIATKNGTTKSATTVVEKSNFYSPGYKYVSTLEITDDSIDLSDPETPVDPEDPNDYDVDLSFDISDAVAIASNSDNSNNNSYSFGIPKNYRKVYTPNDLKSKSVSSNKLVKILTDGSIESIMNLPEGMSPPNISYISTEEDGSVYIIFDGFLHYYNDGRPFTSQFIRVFPDNDFQVLWPLDPFDENYHEKGQIDLRNSYNWSEEKSKPVIKTDNGKIYFKTYKWEEDGEKTNIYLYDHERNTTPELITPNYMLNIRNYKADEMGNIYVEGQIRYDGDRWNFFRVLDENGDYYQHDIYFSTNDYSNNIRDFVPQKNSEGIILNAQNIKSKSGVIKIDVDSSDLDKEFFVSTVLPENSYENSPQNYIKTDNEPGNYLIETIESTSINESFDIFSYNIRDYFLEEGNISKDKILAYFDNFTQDSSITVDDNLINNLETWDGFFVNLNNFQKEESKDYFLNKFFDSDILLYEDIEKLAYEFMPADNGDFFNYPESKTIPQLNYYEWNDFFKDEDGKFVYDKFDLFYNSESNLTQEQIDYIKNWKGYYNNNYYDNEIFKDPIIYDYTKKYYDYNFKNLISNITNYSLNFNENYFFDRMYSNSANIYHYGFNNVFINTDNSIKFEIMENALSYSYPYFEFTENEKTLLNQWDGYYSDPTYFENSINSYNVTGDASILYEYFDKDTFDLIEKIQNAQDHKVLLADGSSNFPAVYYYDWEDFMVDESGNIKRDALEYFLKNYNGYEGNNRDYINFSFWDLNNKHTYVNLIVDGKITNEAYNAFNEWNNYISANYYTYSENRYPTLDASPIYKYVHYLYEGYSNDDKKSTLSENVLIPVSELSTSTTYKIRNFYLDNFGNINSNIISQFLTNQKVTHQKENIDLLNNWDMIFHNDWETRFQENTVEYNTHLIANKIITYVNNIEVSFLRNNADKYINSYSYYKLKWDDKLTTNGELDETKFNNFLNYFDGILDIDKYNFEEIKNWNLYYKYSGGSDGENYDYYNLLNNEFVEYFNKFIDPLNENLFIKNKNSSNYKTIRVYNSQIKDTFYQNSTLSATKVSYFVDFSEYFLDNFDFESIKKSLNNWNGHWHYLYEKDQDITLDDVKNIEFGENLDKYIFYVYFYNDYNKRLNFLSQDSSKNIPTFYIQNYSWKDNLLNEDNSVNLEKLKLAIDILGENITEEQINNLVDWDMIYVNSNKVSDFAKYYSSYSESDLTEIVDTFEKLLYKNLSLLEFNYSYWYNGFYEKRFKWNPNVIEFGELSKERFLDFFKSYYVDDFSVNNEESLFKSLENWDMNLYYSPYNYYEDVTNDSTKVGFFYPENVDPEVLIDFGANPEHFSYKYFNGTSFNQWLRKNWNQNSLQFHNIKELFYDGDENLYAIYSNSWNESLEDMTIFQLMDSKGNQKLDVIEIPHKDNKPRSIKVNGDYIYYIYSIIDSYGEESSTSKIARMSLSNKNSEELLEISGIPNMTILSYDVTKDNKTLFLTGIDWSVREGETILKVDLENGTFKEIPSSFKLDSIEVF